MNKTKIEWCDYTWNPVTGCYHGCTYCYAKRIAERFGCHAISKNDVEVVINPWLSDADEGRRLPYPYDFKPTFHHFRLNELGRKQKPSRIFVSSMGDLFGEWVPDEWIREVFKVCEEAPQHQYIFLTKNPKRFGQLNGQWYNYQCNWPENAWFGTSITTKEDAKRIHQLPYGRAHTFLSIEPLLESIDLEPYLPKPDTKFKCSYCGRYAASYSTYCRHCGMEGGYSGSFRKQPVNWIIVGAQTGPGAKPPKPEWVQKIIDQAREHNIPLFLKDNLNWPEKIQEFPE